MSSSCPHGFPSFLVSINILMEGCSLVLYSTLPSDLLDTCGYSQERVCEHWVVNSMSEIWFMFQNNILLSPSFHILQNLCCQ